MPYSFHGQSTIIPAVTGDYCPLCGEAVFALSEGARTSAWMLAFNRQVNAAKAKPGRAVSPPRGRLFSITRPSDE